MYKIKSDLTSFGFCFLTIQYHNGMAAKYYDMFDKELEKLMEAPGEPPSKSDSDMSEGVKSLAMVGRSHTTVIPKVPTVLLCSLLGVVGTLLILACVVSLVRARRRKKLIRDVAMTDVDVELSNALYREDTKAITRSMQQSTRGDQHEIFEKESLKPLFPGPRRISVTSPHGSIKDLWATTSQTGRPRRNTWSDCNDTSRNDHREAIRAVSVQFISDDEEVPLFDKLSQERKKKKNRK